MSFKELKELQETEEQKSNAAKGFKERLAKYEKQFAAETKQLEPSNAFYDRSYDI